MRRFLVVAVFAALVVPAMAQAWTWPVQGPVLRPFVFGDDPYRAGQHRGIDIGAPSGTAVLAPAPGTISFAGTVPKNGKTVTIQTQDGYSVTLVHLGSVGVKRQATVVEGAVVGTVGPSGEPDLDEPYVYLGIRRTAEPQGYLDPLTLLPGPTASPGAPPESPPTADPAPAAPPAS